MCEVRLISHFKITAQSHVRHDGYDSDLLVDGQFLYSGGNPEIDQVRTHNSAPAVENNHLYVELGGLFKISKIKIWNVRHCCQQRLVGTHVYADEVLVETVVQNTYIYEVEDSVYARRVKSFPSTTFSAESSYSRAASLGKWAFHPRWHFCLRFWVAEIKIFKNISTLMKGISQRKQGEIRHFNFFNFRDYHITDT